MRIGVIGAMQMEVDNLKAVMEDVTTETYSGVEFVSGKYASKDVVVAKCGIGKVFAAICAEAMILKFDVDKIINIGVAGSLTKDLGVLDVAVANNVVQHDMDTSPLGDPVGLLSGINMHTSVTILICCHTTIRVQIEPVKAIPEPACLQIHHRPYSDNNLHHPETVRTESCLSEP